MRKNLRIVMCFILCFFLAAYVTPVYAASKKTATVATQKQLDKAINNSNVTTIKIATSKAVTFKIPNKKNLKKKSLIVNAKKASIKNYATFKSIRLDGSSIAKFEEHGKDNTIVANVSTLNLSLSSKSTLKKLTVNSTKGSIKIAKSSCANQISLQKQSKITITNDGTLKKLDLNKTSTVTLKGNSNGKHSIVVKGKNVILHSSLSMKLDLYNHCTVNVNKKNLSLSINVKEKKVITKVNNKTSSKLKYSLNSKSYSLSSNSSCSFSYTTMNPTKKPTPEVTITPVVTPTPEVTVTPEVKPSPEIPVIPPQVNPSPGFPVIPPQVNPSPEVTVTPEATPSPEVTVTPEVTPTPEITITPEATPSPEITVIPEVSPTPEITVTPEVTPTPEITVTPEVIPTPEITVTPEITPTPEITVTPPDTVPGLDYSSLEEAIANIPKNLDYFTKESVEKLEKLQMIIMKNYDHLTQAEINEYATALNTEIEHLEYRRSDVPQIYISTGLNIQEEIGIYSSAHIAIVDTEGSTHENIIDSSAKIKVRGNTTAYVDKKPFTFKLNKNTDVLGLGNSKKWVLLANAFDPTLLRNELVFRFASTIGLAYTSNTQFVDVWVNGDFLGNYLLTEPVDVGPSLVDLDLLNGDFLLELESHREEDDVTYVRTPIYNYRFALNDPKAPSEDQMHLLNNYLYRIETAIQSNDFEQIATYIDVDSFIDAFITYEVFKNLDVNGSSTRYYIKNGIIYAGPVWDFDLSAGNCSSLLTEYNNTHGCGNNSSNSYEALWAWKDNWFGTLMNNKTFFAKLYDRYHELQPIITNLYEDRISDPSLITTLTTTYAKTFHRNYTLTPWPVDYPMSIYSRKPDSTYEENVEYLRNWLKQRNEWLIKYLEDRKTVN